MNVKTILSNHPDDIKLSDEESKTLFDAHERLIKLAHDEFPKDADAEKQLIFSGQDPSFFLGEEARKRGYGQTDWRYHIFIYSTPSPGEILQGMKNILEERKSK
ncbi:MAG TPA: hypothetical protein ENN13_05455 [Candidatus Altiarchaeales archaeon]|nr:hypothetical protein [Candidatus Altiarchaeales archaeon]